MSDPWWLFMALSIKQYYDNSGIKLFNRLIVLCKFAYEMLSIGEAPLWDSMNPGLLDKMF